MLLSLNMGRRTREQWKLALAAFALVLAAACSTPRNQGLLDQHRNLGKAFYENPTSKGQAVQEFKQASKSPRIPPATS